MTNPVPAIPIDKLRVYADVYAERQSQIAKWGEQHRNLGFGLKTYVTRADKAKERCDKAEIDSRSDNPDDKAPWSAVLEEEFWEALAEKGLAEARAELVQVAAVAVAIIEDIESHHSSTMTDQSIIL